MKAIHRTFSPGRLSLSPPLIVAVITALVMTCPGFASDSRVGFDVRFDRFSTNLSLISMSAAAGEVLVFSTDAAPSVEAGVLAQVDGSWRWTLPVSPGAFDLTVKHQQQTMVVRVFVERAWDGVQPALNGYRIGSYAKTPFRGLASYRKPKGFIEYDPAAADIQVSPSFTLSQFRCKQQPGLNPSYLLLRPELLLKLELILDELRVRGLEVDTLTVMSGFRTPAYNRSIGNTTTSSRHLFGGAADVFVDNDGDGRMDDLNGDGKVDRADARWLENLAEQLAKSSAEGVWRSGGLSAYRSNAAHGPFLHVDVRGYKARW